MISESPADDQFIEKLKDVIRARMSDPHFSVPELAREMGMSRSTLQRRVREIIGKPVNSLVSEERLNRAMKFLNEGKGNVSEVAWETGFGSPTYFIKRFKDHFGFPPGEAKKMVANRYGQANGTPFENNLIHHPGSEKKLRQPDWTKMGIVSSFLLFFALIVFLLAKDYLVQNGRFSWFTGKEDRVKSIAILPFINDSPDSFNIYFINGIMEGITDKLAHISDLKVTSRISAEKYRYNKNKTIRQIARELGVNYIVEGSGQKIGENVLITVQLIEANSDKHLLSKQYSRKYEDIFSLYSEIALDVADEIRAVITRDEMDIIMNPDAVNLDALRLFIRGEKFFDLRYEEPGRANELVLKAETYAREAIGLDSAFCDAWLLLCEVYLFREKTDSAMLMVQAALQIDDEDYKPYLMMGDIYYKKSNAAAMESSFKTALKYDPANIYATHMLGGLRYARGEFYEAFKALIDTRRMLGNLNPGLTHSELYMAESNTLRLARTLFVHGFYEAGKKYAEEWHSISNEKGEWVLNYNLMWGGIINQRFNETYKQGKETPEEELCFDYMAMNLMFLKRYPEAMEYLQKAEEQSKKEGKENQLLNFLLGFCYLKTGDMKKSDCYFDKVLTFINSYIQSHPEVTIPALSYAITDRYWKFPYFILTSIHAVRGEREKALENLRLLSEKYQASDLQVVFLLKCWPMFDNIRSEREFRDYLQEAESHYLKEHARVEELLRAEGIIM